MRGFVVRWSVFLLVALPVLLLMLLVVGVVAPGPLPAWLGLGPVADADGRMIAAPKTLWDVLELVIVPLALALAAYALDRSEKRAEAARQAERARQEALTAYVSAITALVLDRGLRRSTEAAPARAVARTLTLVTARAMDGARRGVILRFLVDMGLISGDRPVVALAAGDFSDADLGSANLAEQNLVNANLTGANLEGAGLRRAILGGANLTAADLLRADLSGAELARIKLVDADLTGAKLRGATLIKAEMTGANLAGADLTGANLTAADLREADLRGARLAGATLKAAKLAGAQHDAATTWPAGFDAGRSGRGRARSGGRRRLSLFPPK